MRTQNWTFVTGTPRSGTTFVGKVLSVPLEVDYLHEPFNPRCGMAGIDQQYLYVRQNGNGPSHYQRLIEKLFCCDVTFKTEYLAGDKWWKNMSKAVIGSRSAWYLRFAKLNPFHKATVIKDPIGCLLTEYLFQNFGVKPVIIIRHPVAVVASAVRLNWNMDLEPIRQQQELVEDYFLNEPEFLYTKRTDRIENAAALWRALNKVLLDQASRHPDWQVVTHETLSQRPVETFSQLYEALGLPWSPKVEKKVITLTRQENRIAAPQGQIHEFRRNSAELFQHSLKMLSREQREKIYEITKDVALQVYPQESFKLDSEE